MEASRHSPRIPLYAMSGDIEVLIDQDVSLDSSTPATAIRPCGRATGALLPDELTIGPVRLRVIDLDRALAFYVGVLGLTRHDDTPGDIVRLGTPVEGTADHGTHEAIYLPDPDGNGLELAVDRPSSELPDMTNVESIRPRALDSADLGLDRRSVAIDRRVLVRHSSHAAAPAQRLVEDQR